MRRVHVIDSHTEGEPTRIILSGGPDLGGGPLWARRDRFRVEFDSFRRAVVNEPRGSDVAVGGLLVPPLDPASLTGVIFFDNVGYLGMCGHGTIGLLVSLAYAKNLAPGGHQIETPVGPVQATLLPTGAVSVENVASYCHKMGVEVTVPGYGRVVGDVAWGGNWFFLIDKAPCELSRANLPQLVDYTRHIQLALGHAGVTGADHEPIDHVEVSGPPSNPSADGRNFVLCPGGMYDRSPCGTGTSAKMATLLAHGQLKEGQPWRQEGILGGIFEGVLVRQGERLIPRITGTAYLTADAELLLDERDPYRDGFPQ